MFFADLFRVKRIYPGLVVIAMNKRLSMVAPLYYIGISLTDFFIFFYFFFFLQKYFCLQFSISESIPDIKLSSTYTPNTDIILLKLPSLI